MEYFLYEFINIARGGYSQYSYTIDYIEDNYTISSSIREKQDLVIATPPAMKNYDGTALTNTSGYTITASGGGDDWSSGNVDILITITGSQTKVGQSLNTFRIDYIAYPDMYNIIPNYGTLTVFPAPIDPPDPDPDPNPGETTPP